MSNEKTMKPFMVESLSGGWFRVSNSIEVFENIMKMGMKPLDLVTTGKASFHFFEDSFTVRWVGNVPTPLYGAFREGNC